MGMSIEIDKIRNPISNVYLFSHMSERLLILSWPLGLKLFNTILVWWTYQHKQCYNWQSKDGDWFTTSAEPACTKHFANPISAKSLKFINNQFWMHAGKSSLPDYWVPDYLSLTVQVPTTEWQSSGQICITGLRTFIPGIFALTLLMI